MRATLVEQATEPSYRKSGRCIWNESRQLSGQTVMNAVREGQTWKPSWARPNMKRRVPYLYIEADEDHVPNKDGEGSRWQPGLVYVHEGAEDSPGHRRPKNVFHFGGVSRGQGATETLRSEVWQGLDAHFDRQSVYVLGRFRAAKKLRAAAGCWDDRFSPIWRSFKKADR